MGFIQGLDHVHIVNVVNVAVPAITNERKPEVYELKESSYHPFYLVNTN